MTRELITAVEAPAPTPRAAIRSEHQAIVVVERRMSRVADPKAEQMPPGWRWVLGNSMVGQLYDQLFAEAQLTWSSLVVPQEQQETFASLAHLAAARQPLVCYDAALRIAQTSLAAPPEESEAVFMVFNGHCFPLCDLNLALGVHWQNRCDVTFIDFSKDRRRSGYDEKLQLEQDGRVRRVNRLYEHGPESLQVGRDWPAIVLLSSQAMERLVDVGLPYRLSQWPAALLRAGLSVRGATIPGRSFSLHDREHLYELNEVLLRLKPEWLAKAGGLVDQGQKIWVGKNVRIDSSASLIGPVVLGDHVEIGPNAVLVGPTTVGRGSTIGADVVLKRCVVMPDTTLAKATVNAQALSHAVVIGSDRPTIQAITPSSSASDADLKSLMVERTIRLETVLEATAVPALSGFRYRMFRFTKRAVDIVGSVFALILIAPFLPLIALAIKINSSGPIFYAQIRQGMGGRNFRCWKFRTMVPDAEKIQRKLMAKNEVDGPQFKMKDDPRIFWVGKWLRRLNLDEWPQFFNVLIGQMSIVGPRPSPERENQMCPAWREARLSVRPGITGLWQVMRRRGESDFQEWIYYDIQYIKKQSVWLDTKIVLKTILVAIGRGQ